MRLVIVVILLTLSLLVPKPPKMREVHRCDKDHCGCVNWKNCSQPCTGCCGPNGMADCFKNPRPD